MEATGMSEPTEKDCEDLMRELGLGLAEGSVGVGSGIMFVMIYERRKKPALVTWRGWPIAYRLGVGMPSALGAAA